MTTRPQLLSGAALDIFDELDSTSLEAKRRYEAGARGPVWIVARRQTAGYGRRGSAWLQREGDVAATLLTTIAAPAAAIAQLSFIMGLAAAEAAERSAPAASVRLKWPNDLILDGAKLGGLLAELLDAGATQSTIALGFGVNLISAPADVGYRTARLADSAPAPAAVAFVSDLDACLDAWLAVWRRDGFSPVREGWLARCYGLGAPARLFAGSEAVEGVVEGIDSLGGLVLRTPDGVRSFAAGTLIIGD